MTPIEFAAVGVLVIAFSAVSMRVATWPVTMPMVFVGAGAVTDAFGLIDVSAERESIALLAEVTLAVILFTDASRIDIVRLRRFLSIPIRLLAVGLPLSIVLGAVVNRLLFPDLPFAQVALIAAILAPTDAALGSAVVEDDVVPARERLALNVESGVNDGLVVPVVAFLTAVVIGESRTTASWFGFVGQQIGWGIGVGVVVGGSTIVVLRWAHDRGWTDARFEQLATFAVPIVALFGAAAVSGNSFIAAFSAGLVFGSLGGEMSNADTADTAEAPLSERLGAFTEDAAQLLALVTFFVFGNVLVADAVDRFSIAVALCAVLTLTVGRIVPVWVALVGTPLRAPSRLFVGWFGPRGLASIVFGLLLLEDTDTMTETGETLFGVIALTVTASVVLHGASASWGAQRYGRWADSTADADMARVADSPMPRSRWSRRRPV